ncbi:Ribosomal RNA small subunit methyltransferase H [Zostera marina]|uniref:Ribosomal RNA small subunit methyltransferase H n=1 Tax=Zostera marina TaxID=29655 RepID=A0A0K9PLU8_ZOSMR|nr:Ribosomal RNA small subunit methyltransferase H [Zostera marina]
MITMTAAKQFLLFPCSSFTSSSSVVLVPFRHSSRCFYSVTSSASSWSKRRRKMQIAVCKTGKNHSSKSEEKAILKLKDIRVKRRTRSTLGFDRFKFPLEETSPHVPVMLGEVLQVFQSVHLRSFVDCTLGAAGHSLPIIGSHPEMHFYFGLDVDPVAFELGRSRIHSVLHTPNSGTNTIDRSQLLKVYTHLRNFKHIKSVISTAALEDDDFLLLHKGINGVLMDLGMSSMQVNDSNRGFSILGDGPLDMRMDPQASLKAEEILNLWPETEVGRIIRDYGEESNWRLLQKKIVNARSFGGLHSTNDLVQLIQKLSFNGSGGRQGWIKTATRVFQALRIAVNDELKTLEDSLYACFDSLSPGGRLAVISFHSLEDRIVKQTFLDIISKKHNNSGIRDDSSALPLYLPQEEETWCKGRISGTNGIILNKRPITPCEEEEKLNKRSRSAKLRVIQKI